MTDNLLEIKNGNLIYKSSKAVTHAMDDINLEVYKNEVLGVVGESGSGKSTTGKVLTQLLDLTSGSLYYKGTDITNQSNSQKRASKKDLQYIHQDARSALNPRKKIGWLIEEPLRINTNLSHEERLSKIKEYMAFLQIPKNFLDLYPENISGGQAQRINILASILLDPEFLVADEIVSALDVSVQAGVINFILDLKEKFNFSMVFITHDIRVCYLVSDRIIVMYKGQIVEEGNANDIYNNPLHPYTKELFNSVYVLGEKQVDSKYMEGVDTRENIGCRYANRCIHAQDICYKKRPDLYKQGEGKVRCLIYNGEVTPKDISESVEVIQ